MNITLNLTTDQINVLMAGLGELPLKVSAAVWLEVKKQAEAQMQAEGKVEAE